MYKIIPKKGDSYIVNESHILSLKYSSKVNKNTPKGSIIDIPLIDYMNLPKSYHGKGGVLVGYRVPIVFPKKEVFIEPYLLGYWLETDIHIIVKYLHKSLVYYYIYKKSVSKNIQNCIFHIQAINMTII